MTVFISYLTLFSSIFLPQLYTIFGYSSTITVPQVLSAVNAERQSAGLESLKLNDALSAAAQAKANNMIANSYWAHTSPSGEEPWDFINQSGYRYRKAGENLARNFAATPEMIEAWLVSPTHRENLLGAEYQDTGIAVLQGEMDGVPTTLVVQMFGKPAVMGAQADSKTSQNETSDRASLTGDDTGDTNTALSASPKPGFEPYAGNTEAEDEILLGTNILQGSNQPFLTRSRLILIGAGLMIMSLVINFWRDWRVKNRFHKASRGPGKSTIYIYAGAVLLFAAMILIALNY